jgi:N-acyl homoserine lactone hydrolase
VSAAVGVEVVVTGWLRIPRAYVERPARGNVATRLARVLLRSGGTLRSPCLAFVLRHPEAGTLLVDTGFHPDAGEDLRGDFGTRMGLVFGSLEPAAGGFAAQLRDRGIEPDAIERVAMTHLHVDHTSGMRLLPRARFACARAEWEAATGSGAGSRGYVEGHLPPPDRVELVDLAVGEPFGPFEHTVDWLSDGSIRLISTPGHTRGHTSVLVRSKSGPILIAGDAAYTLRALEEGVLPLFTDPADEPYLDSLRRLREFAAAEPEAVVVPTHDPDAWRALDGGRE